jgi:hypothetical protein
MSDLPQRLYRHNSGPEKTLFYVVPDDFTGWGVLMAAVRADDDDSGAALSEALRVARKAKELLRRCGGVRIAPTEGLEVVVTVTPGAVPPTREQVREEVARAIREVLRG